MILTGRQAASAIGSRKLRVKTDMKIYYALKDEPTKADLRAMLTQAVHNTVKESTCHQSQRTKTTAKQQQT